ncbi:Olfactory receptor 13G1 [Camelus dromedarius]|uniref:Olfactory receptor 13G1 n=1 Tax=Camelus dromedarius TaxID=9838 RepID=A0A5N4DK77_CAMDR|nr:Olfactory receptor 13G1 [Camelus dromedarius]
MQVLLGPGQQSEARDVSQVFCAQCRFAKTVESSGGERELMVASVVVCTSTVLPMLLETLVVKGGTISCGACMTQLFFLTWLLGAELLLLTATACDGHEASAPAAPRRWPGCGLLAGGVWAVSVAGASAHAGLVMRLTSRSSVRSSTSSVKPRPAAALLQPRTRTRNNVMVDRHGGWGLRGGQPPAHLGVLRLHHRQHPAHPRGRGQAAPPPPAPPTTCRAHALVVSLRHSAVFYTHPPGSRSSVETGGVAALLCTAASPTPTPSSTLCGTRPLRKVFSCIR